jgi:hypothetical protein
LPEGSEVMNRYAAYVKRAIRILLLLAAVMFGAQFAEATGTLAEPAAHPNASGQASREQAPQRQTAQQPPASRPPAEAAGAEGAEEQASQPDAEMQREVLDAMRQQFERETLDRIRYGNPSYGMRGFVDDISPIFAFVGVTLAILWILRTVLDNRRWYRMVKVQTDTHAKLLDRLASSQEMLAYMQSEAGRKFLEAPLFEDQRRQVSILPFSRILWSVQVGIVGAFLGSGILFLRGRVAPDADMGLAVFGTLILALGIGFLVSGGVSYLLARYFGLLEQRDALARSGHSA